MPRRGVGVGRWLRPAFYLGQNPLSLIGAILTTSAGLTLVAFWAYLILKGGPVHPDTIDHWAKLVAVAKKHLTTLDSFTTRELMKDLEGEIRSRLNGGE